MQPATEIKPTIRYGNVSETTGHLTDIQGNGSEWGEKELINLFEFGTGQLIQNGKAVITLYVSDPDRCKVYWIDGNGKRRGIIESTVSNGKLTFDVSTKGPEGGRIYYEIDKRQ